MSILHPLISMVVLTFLVAIRLGYFAINSVFKGKVHIKQLRVYDGEFPIDYKSARQHYKNMYESSFEKKQTASINNKKLSDIDDKFIKNN